MNWFFNLVTFKNFLVVTGLILAQLMDLQVQELTEQSKAFKKL